MNTRDLIEALDQRYGNPYATEGALIQEAIKQLRFLLEDNEALTQELNERFEVGKSLGYAEGLASMSGMNIKGSPL